jgi:hypothetical protein
MSLDIKDFLEQYVKPNALKLGGEVAITDIEGGLVGLDSQLVQLQDWTGDTLEITTTEGDRATIQKTDGNLHLFSNGQLGIGFKPVSGGSNISGNNVIISSQQVDVVTSGTIGLYVQSDTGQLNFRAGSSASSSGVRFVSNSAGVGELTILFSDINGGPGLPTGTASLVANQLWNDNGTLKIYTP